MILRAALWVRAKLKAQRRPARAVILPGQRLPMCQHCLHFRNDPADIEAALPGFATFGSGRSAVRADDGLCVSHDRFVTTQSSCPKFSDRLAKGRPGVHKPG
jgi:hypothetical protein